jgi:alkanesulfonate monooxygenase SsuD/methylene tetrahydromethanopterin reductase-like flavin-dependent oxidoreductase (luciferase family)
LIKERWQRESPPPLRNPIPILIGGEGERITLRLAAQHAHIWNGFGPAERFRIKNEALDRWCRELGRDPGEIERSVLSAATSAAQLDALLEAGASHIIAYLAEPWNFRLVERLVRWRDQRRRR